jgi:hypothetical protein
MGGPLISPFPGQEQRPERRLDGGDPGRRRCEAEPRRRQTAVDELRGWPAAGRSSVRRPPVFLLRLLFALDRQAGSLPIRVAEVQAPGAGDAPFPKERHRLIGEDAVRAAAVGDDFGAGRNLR